MFAHLFQIEISIPLRMDCFSLRFQDEFWKYTNFVATDFFTSNNLIQISKEANIRRQNWMLCQKFKDKKAINDCTSECV